MTIVIDASVIVAALSDTGRDGSWAESLIASETLVAPELAMVEATNILRRLELAKELTPVESGLAQKDLMRLDIQLFPFHPFAECVWALRKNITSYDCPSQLFDRVEFNNNFRRGVKDRGRVNSSPCSRIFTSLVQISASIDP